MIVKKVETKAELDQAYTVRTIVFVQEQNVPVDLEIDEHDETAIHFIGLLNGEVIAAADCGLLMITANWNGFVS